MKSKGIINNQKDESIKVFNLLGRQLVNLQSTGERIVIPLESGSLYIVNVSSSKVKVVL